MSAKDRPEVWRHVPGLPDAQASSWGRIRRLPRVIEMPDGGTRAYQPQPTYGVKRRSKTGAKHVYLAVHYRGLGNIKVHRAVCQVFHGLQKRPDHRVLHRDEDGLNNEADNVYWGTQKENLNAPGFLEYCRGRTGENNPNVKGRKAKQA